MHHALIVSRDEKLINFIIQTQVDHNFKIVHKSEIFQGLKVLSRKKFDIMIYDIDSQDLDVLYALKIAKQLNRDIHLIVLTGDKSFLPLRSVEKPNIDYLQFKPLEFDRLKFHLDCLIKGEISDAKQN